MPLETSFRKSHILKPEDSSPEAWWWQARTADVLTVTPPVASNS